MRDYGKVHTSFWASSNIRSMSEDGRTLAIYLLTCPHGTIAGVFRLPDGYACEDLQWPSERVREGFVELLRSGFANRCETTKWVWVIKHLEWNPPENPNQRKSAAKVAGQVPDECGWKAAFMRDCAEQLGIKQAENGNTSETLPKPLTNQEQDQEQEEKKPREAARSEDPTSGKSKAVVSAKEMTESMPGLSADVAADFIAHRKAKRCPLTASAWKSIVSEVEASKWAPDAALSEAMAAGWQGVKADWLANRKSATSSAPAAGNSLFAGCQ